MEAYTKNPTLGDQRDVTPDRPDGNRAAMEVDDEICAWERENASSYPRCIAKVCS